MMLIRWTFTSIAWFLLIGGARADEPSTPDPLFQSNEIIDVRIVAPISTLVSERPIDAEVPGTFQFTNSAGTAVAFDIKLRTRGRFRRDKSNCRFPPLRLNFVMSQTKGTLFHKQNKVKLVTHCQNSATYAQALLREYTAYRILNVMTDASFRVRLLRVTYVDSENQAARPVRYAFIIEHRDRLAKRIRRPVLDIPRTTARSLNAAYMNMISVFHYLLGNTDFSAIRAAEGETCCHNHVLFGNENEAVWSVPYDFDQAGLVNAPHAAPSPNFNIRNVRQRLYRGRCLNNEILKQTIARYEDKKEQVLAVLAEVDAATTKSIKSMTAYVEKFYATIESQRRVASKLVKKCI